MKLEHYFQKHPVFTRQEFASFVLGNRKVSARTPNDHLRYYIEKGRLVRIRQSLYASVPIGYSADQFKVDPFLLIAKITGDSVIAYHSALEFFGKSYSIYHAHTYLTRSRPRNFIYDGIRFRAVQTPKNLSKGTPEKMGVIVRAIKGMHVRITSLERTLVDVMDRQDLTGSWEEIWRSLESIEFFDLDKVVDYLYRLNNATTTAKVGYFLEQHAESLMADESYLFKFESMRPKQPHYMSRKKSMPGRLNRRWNLIIPQQIIDRSWEEVF
jgi:predicted transcriptional regulator of viral defense system